MHNELINLLLTQEWAYQDSEKVFTTDSGSFLQNAEQLLMTLAGWGYFPSINGFAELDNHSSSNLLPLQCFTKRPYIIRHATMEDLPILVELERRCWIEPLQASSDEIEERLLTYAKGHFVLVMENRVVGVIYSQRIDDSDALMQHNFRTVAKLHHAQAPITQLLAANVLPEMQHYGLGDQLLEFILQYSTLKRGISGVVAVTLCKNYVNHSHLPMEEYIQKRTLEGRIFDPILHFHESHGATIKRAINGYRPEDVDNQGQGILVEYDLLHRRERIGDKLSPLRQDKRNIQSSSSLVEEAIRSVMGAKRQVAFSSERPLMEMGLDSLELLELKSLLSQRFVQELNPTFFFRYGTATAITGYFEGQIQPSSQVSPHRAVLNSRLPEPQPSTQDAPSVEEKERSYKQEPIAIISMACRFPGGVTTPEAYWTLLQEGVDAITTVPQTRWHPADYAGQIKSRYGGFLDNVAQFDASFFRMAPVEVVATDPQQRLLLEVTWEALERAGYDPSALARSETGVFVGIFSNDYQLLQAKQRGSPTAYFGTGTSSSVAAGRLSYFFGFQGPAMAVDTACSSSLVAVHLACQSLHSGECDLALASGVNLLLSPELSITFSEAGMLAPDGRCKTFDAQANGYVRSEGCGTVILKRLKDAQRDNDNILAVVRGSAVNQDGTSNGLTAPNGLAQEAVIRKALVAAGLEPTDVSYVEAHGTGTSLGDPVEVQALEAVYGEGRTVDNPLVIGSVKTNIGHTEAAAGMAGLLKVVLSMQQGYLPPHLHFKKANPYLTLEQIPAVIPTEGMDWENEKGPRLAGVSSFGFSGTNAHILLEEAPANKKATSESGEPSNHHLLTLSAQSQPALSALAQRYADFFETNSTHTLADVCFTTHIGRAHFEHRLAIVTETDTILSEQLHNFANEKGKETSGLFKGQINSQKQPKIAFLFTGQGSQYVEMGRELYETQPTFRRVLNRCDDILRPYLEQPLLSILYPRDSSHPSMHDGQAAINQTIYTQPALFALEYALAELWKSWGITPDIVMGHSVGEYAAACVAGIFSLEDGLKLIAARGRLMQQLPQNGAMVAVRASESQVQDILTTYTDKVSIAAINAPESLVISGEQQAVQVLMQAFEAQGIKTKRLTVSHAFHSPLMEPMLSEFNQVANEIHFSPPQACADAGSIKLISNVTGCTYTDEMATPAYWVRHVRHPVRFVNGMETLNNLGAEIFIEIGPKPTLLGLGRRCLSDNQEAGNVPHQWLPSLRFGWSDWQQILTSLGELYARGMKIDWEGFNLDEQHQRVLLPTYPFQRERYWIEITTDDRHSLCVLPTPGEVVHNLSSTSLIAQSASHEELLAHLESLSVKYILSALKQMGWRGQVGQRFSAQQLVVDMGIQGHQALLDRLLDILAEEEILQRRGEEWEIDVVPESERPQPLLDKYPMAEAELTLLARCGSKLADVLQGRCNPVQLLFPEADVTTLATLYQDSPAFGAMNKLVEQVIFQALAGLEAGQMVHILEIGAGTGGTTTHILPHLPASQTKYVFSDIGPLFLAKAQDKFKDYPFISYRQLNIEQDPQAQGFGEAQFDLILAANVLHATKNLSQSLEHVYSLLAPNGLLILLEGVARRRWIDLTFGLTEGWWRFTDYSLRPDYPLLSPPQWSQLLQEIDFKEVSYISLNEMNEPLFPQAVVIAQAPEKQTAFRNREGYSLETLRHDDKTEQHIDILQALQSTPEDQRQALLATYVCKQIAPILGVLEATAIGTQTQFIEMGMDSLMSMELANRLQSSLNCRLPSGLTLEYPTVAKLVDYLATKVIGKEEVEGAASPSETTAETTDVSAATNKKEETESVYRYAPTSILQERQWIVIQRDEDSNYSHIFQAWDLGGSLHVVTLKRALTEIVRRHEALRTTFKVISGALAQVITPPSPISLPLIDLRALSATERSDKVQQLIRQESSRSFDLVSDRLIRALLLQLGDEHHVLLLTTTCIVCDYVSIGILNQELSVLYAAFLHHASPAQPSLSMQYADYAVWEREYLAGTVLAKHLSYWEQKLSGLEPLALPTDRLRPPVRTFRSNSQYFLLSADLVQKLEMLSRSSGCTLSMIFLSAYAILLSRYSGQNDFAVGTPFSCRNQTEVESLIGWFIVHIPLRINLKENEENPSFQDLLNQVRQTMLESLAHRYIPLEQLSALLEQGYQKNQPSWFQVGFNYRNQTRMWHNLELAGLEVTNLDGENQREQAAYNDLDLFIHETEQGIEGKFLYNTNLFDAATIARMTRHFQTLLESIVANPKMRIAELPLLSQTEQNQLLYEWNDTQTSYSYDKCIYQLFEEQVEKTPDAVAVEHEGIQLTYQELNHRANQLAHHLQELGAGPGGFVGICLNRSIDMIISLFAVLKSGAAYLPLDPTYPSERLAYMLNYAQVHSLITKEHLFNRLEPVIGKDDPFSTVYLDREHEKIAQKSKANPQYMTQPNNLAYLMYTSGSTGQPKGVLIEHGSLTNFIEAARGAFEITDTDRVLQFSSISFDAAVEEIFSSLTAGATLVLRTEEMLSGIATFVQRCQEWQLTVLDIPTAYWHLFISELASSNLCLPPSVRLVVIGGDRALAGKVKLWQDYIGDYPHLLNVYGPTEGTAVATMYHFSNPSAIRYTTLPKEAPLPDPPIGRPINNAKIYILDELLQPVPIGVAGNLYIGGVGVARGYKGRPKLTQERFIPDPFSTDAGARMYHTGDLARYLPDRNLEFLGRADNQVKIRGYRVEIAEIETWLTQAPNVREAIVLVKEEQPGNKRLVAYLVPSQPPLMVSDVRQFLKEKLPDYMMPSAFVVLEAMPLNQSGKIDRHALPELTASDLSAERAIMAPRNTTELKLVTIWETVLNVHPIGVQNNFFELGGHSLLAISLLAQIQAQFGQEFPLSGLFQHPTVEEQARFLSEETEGQAQGSSPLISIQPKGQKPPIFFVHPIGGGALCYTHLSHQLGKEQPFYGLQSPGIDGEQEPLATIEEMATLYNDALKGVQPEGPYYLGGWSLGGLIAFEMARQLHASGNEVALLALIDSYSAKALKVSEDAAADHVFLASFFARNLLAIADEEVAISDEQLQDLTPDGQLDYILEQAKKRQVLPNAVTRQQIQQLFNVFKSNRRAMARYTPQSYPGQITFFFARDTFAEVKENPTQGWSDITTGLDVHEIQGDHYTIVQSSTLVDKLRTKIANSR